MERRKFIKNIGLGASPLILPSVAKLNNDHEDYPAYIYNQPTNLRDAKTKDGQIIIRLEFHSVERFESLLKPEIIITNGNILRSKPYFFEYGEDEHYNEIEVVSSTAAGDKDILVLWLDQFSEKTVLSLKNNTSYFQFFLLEIVEKLEVKGSIGNTNIKANFLLDKEIGELNPNEVGIQDSGADFSLILMADPQGGDISNPEDNRCRMKIHNAFIEESVKLANNLKIKPAFCLIVGDIVDHQGEARDFAQMHKFFDKLKMPVLYEMGNHESKYRTAFSPGYNLSGFNNYFAAQKAINGMEKLLYSFNLGKWHFVVWPDPLRREFWENHPHYFDWLEQDLEKHKDRPTVFFQHIPMHPIGINPLVNYAESATVKRLLFDILSKHGNVKNIFSGHVHIPIKSSFKTAVSIKGINCINLPAAGYRPRAFGEEEYYGRPSQGICIVDIKGTELTATYKAVTKEEFVYPSVLPQFEEDRYPLWFKYKWELPANSQFVNGNFKDGLLGWGKRFVYQEDCDPANVCEVRNLDTSALYLKTKKRAFHAPGQDRLPQDINRVFQTIKLSSGKSPFIDFEYKLDKKDCDFDAINGFYIWVEGFNGSTRITNQLYFANKAWTRLGSTYGNTDQVSPVIFSLDNTPDVWHRTSLNIKEDFEKNRQGLKFFKTIPDRLCISAGIWNINDGREGQPFAAFIKNFKINYDLDESSNVGGNTIVEAAESIQWHRGKLVPWNNIAGEHHYHLEGLIDLKY